MQQTGGSSGIEIIAIDKQIAHHRALFFRITDPVVGGIEEPAVGIDVDSTAVSADIEPSEGIFGDGIDIIVRKAIRLPVSSEVSDLQCFW